MPALAMAGSRCATPYLMMRPISNKVPLIANKAPVRSVLDVFSVFLLIKKVDLALIVNASINIMESGTLMMYGEKPFRFFQQEYPTGRQQHGRVELFQRIRMPNLTEPLALKKICFHALRTQEKRNREETV